MNFTALQTEAFSRGFDYLNDGGTGLARMQRWINESYQELCQAADWPFLETSTSGAAPVTVADLRKVLTVHDATTHLPLRPTVRTWLVATFGDVASTVGSPRFYWVENGVVRAYPVAGTLTVYYIKFPVDLAAGGDTPVVPSRFHDIIVDGAIRRAYEDRDDYGQASELEASRLQRIEGMKAILLTQAVLPDIDDQAEGQPVQQ